MRFQLIAAANSDLAALVANGTFRTDLLARLSRWTVYLPPLRACCKDMQANIEFKLQRAERRLGTQIGFNKDAFDADLRFARDPGSLWSDNFRDLRRVDPAAVHPRALKRPIGTTRTACANISAGPG